MAARGPVRGRLHAPPGHVLVDVVPHVAIYPVLQGFPQSASQWRCLPRPRC